MAPRLVNGPKNGRIVGQNDTTYLIRHLRITLGTRRRRPGGKYDYWTVGHPGQRGTLESSPLHAQLGADPGQAHPRCQLCAKPPTV